MPPEVYSALCFALHYRVKAGDYKNRRKKHKLLSKCQKHLSRAEKYLTKRS